MIKRAAWATSAFAFSMLGSMTVAADENSAGGLSEIIVTATRRPTYLEQTPIAITAISGADIDRQHTQDFSNIAIVSPSVVFTALSRQESYPSIRGTTVGNDAPGSDLGVSVFIDDVPTTGVGDNVVHTSDGFELVRTQLIFFFTARRCIAVTGIRRCLDLNSLSTSTVRTLNT
jgi:outer membrane receptor protein involved in Fe transport